MSQWAAGEFARIVANPADQLTALHEFEVLNFWYIDRISELVLAEYQAECDRWLAHRSTVRSETLQRALEGDDLRATSAGLAGLETAAQRLAAAVGVTDRPLFWARDPTTAWVWVRGASDRSPTSTGYAAPAPI